MMIYVTPKQAELLSYLTGRQPVGELFTAPRLEIAADIGRSKFSISQTLRELEDKGCVVRSGPFLKVIRRLEDPDVIEGMPPEPPKASRPAGRRGLIKYAGYDENEARNW